MYRFLEYTWNRQIFRKTTNIFVRECDWNQSLHQGRGGVQVSYGPESACINALLLARVTKIDNLLTEYNQNHPNQITAQVINDILADKPITRKDHGKDFIDLALDPIIIRATNYSVFKLTDTKKIHHSQNTIKEFGKYEDGEFTLYVEPNKELIGRILQMGNGLVVTSPPEVRSMFWENVLKLADLYRE